MTPTLLLTLLPLLLLLFAFSALAGTTWGAETIFLDNGRIESVCSGTSSGFSMVQGMEHGQLPRLKNMYENCTRVLGNLEITGILAQDIQKNKAGHDFSFLSDIREVSGYVLIANNVIWNLSLPSLEIIRGERGIEGDALHVSNNPNLQAIYMPRLRSIHQRGVSVVRNRLLCTWKTIKWDNLFTSSKQGLIFLNNTQDCGNYGYECSRNCTEGACWGPGEDACQDLHKKGCAAQCTTGQCFTKGGGTENCCHPSCVAGCTGPRNTDCLACAKFESDGACLDSCPKLWEYNRDQMKREENPDGRYAYQQYCLRSCPKNMLVLDGSCVSACPENMYAPDSGDPDKGPYHCKPCDKACPKSCIAPPNLHKALMKDFANCTVLQGNLLIRFDTFTKGGYMDPDGKLVRTEPVTPMELEVFKSLRKVTGHVFIQSHVLQNLSFLRNLEVIEGRHLADDRFSLEISANSELRELGLISLTSIRNGDVEIRSNPDLCHADTIDWNSLLAPGRGSHVVDNRAGYVCEREGLKCSGDCDPSGGCWGPGPSTCLRCRNFRLDGVCVQDCLVDQGQYVMEPAVCDHCHKECLTCIGPGPTNCTACKHFRLEGECVESCPMDHYADGAECLACHPHCNDRGCTGPSHRAGPGGCRQCRIGAREGPLDSELVCLRVFDQTARSCIEAGYTSHYLAVPGNAWSSVSKDYVCLPCHPACSSCVEAGTGIGSPSRCECATHVVGGKYCAQSSCPSRESYEMEEKTLDGKINCGLCDPECEGGCSGSSPSQCNGCQNYRQVASGEESEFTCVFNCSGDTPHPYLQDCFHYDHGAYIKQQRITSIVGAVMAVLFVLLILAVGCFVYRHKFISLKKLYTDVEIPESPGYKPNMSRLRIIKHSELRKGVKLGEGAFGIVFSGVYKPDGESVKVPVAIKELTRWNPDSEKEMLDEATHMASLNHAHLVRLVGICVSEKTLLVTPLMPLGNLRDYIKNNQNRIGSYAMLKWAHQIAQGMEHLEEHRLVHRDLAARNVLVRNPGHVAVTDFGLAKMLDYGEKEVVVEGRVPVKWLALESITHRRFTHKSDVWAYGVTLWEILSFGRHPYEETPIQRILEVLKNGQRLEQPPTCTINLYMLLINCWMLDESCRPSFAELVSRVGEFLKSPSTYVTIPNDRYLRLPSSTDETRRVMEAALFPSEDDLVMDAAAYFDSAQLTDSTTLDPTTPTSPSKPRHHGRAGPSRHSSVGSRRYASDPLNNLPPHSEDLLGEEDTAPSTDADNYLTPNSVLAKSNAANPDYTRVLDGSKPTYYNDVAGRVGKEGEVGLENLEYLAPSSTLHPVPESETTV